MPNKQVTGVERSWGGGVDVECARCAGTGRHDDAELTLALAAAERRNGTTAQQFADRAGLALNWAQALLRTLYKAGLVTRRREWSGAAYSWRYMRAQR